MSTSWIAIYPQWYLEERERLARHYPQFRVDDKALRQGRLHCFGELLVRPPGGTVRHPVWLIYPEATPFEMPFVVPLERLPERDSDGSPKEKLQSKLFDHRHQMPGGLLCLFQRDTRSGLAGERIRGIDVLRRAEQWFLEHHTGHWPADSVSTELEPHFEHAGDILLSNVFFSPDIDGFGRFFMVPDFRRHIDAVEDDLCPMIMTAVTVESGGVAKYFDARDDLSRIYPWIQGEAWSPTKILESDNSDSSAPVAHGYWWSLSHEPRPFRNGEGFLRELERSHSDPWSQVTSLLKHDLLTANVHYLGLRYPGRHGEWEWLILCMLRGKKSNGILIESDEKKRRGFERAGIGCVRVHTARPNDLRLRNTSVVDKRIEDRTVALIGLGALGSPVAELLAKAGVGRFRLCDSDRLGTGNVARHIGGLHEFGAYKVCVVMSRMLEINPYLKFGDGDSSVASAVRSLDQLATFIAPADLTICTTANENVESTINQIAVIQRKPVLYGRALRRGSMGRVFLVRPGVDPCKACLGEYARAGRSGEAAPDGWIDVEESPDDILLHECGRPVIPASAADLSFVAALIARVAIDYLEGRSLEANHWLWSRPAAVEVAPRFNRPMVTHIAQLPRWAECGTCREPDVVGVAMSQEIYDSVVAMTEASPESETGGILIGFIDDDHRAVVVRATGPGPNAERLKSGFARDVEFVQGELDWMAREVDSRAVYIGEWHSHLEADPEPSSRDIESMFGIATAPNYLTRCPVLLIAGLDPATRKVAALKTWACPVGGRIYLIENDFSSVAEEGLRVRDRGVESPLPDLKPRRSTSD